MSLGQLHLVAMPEYHRGAAIERSVGPFNDLSSSEISHFHHFIPEFDFEPRPDLSANRECGGETGFFNWSSRTSHPRRHRVKFSQPTSSEDSHCYNIRDSITEDTSGILSASTECAELEKGNTRKSVEEVKFSSHTCPVESCQKSYRYF